MVAEGNGKAKGKGKPNGRQRSPKNGIRAKTFSGLAKHLNLSQIRAITLKFLGFTNEEIGEQVGVTLATINSWFGSKRNQVVRDAYDAYTAEQAEKILDSHNEVINEMLRRSAVNVVRSHVRNAIQGDNKAIEMFYQQIGRAAGIQSDPASQGLQAQPLWAFIDKLVVAGVMNQLGNNADTDTADGSGTPVPATQPVAVIEPTSATDRIAGTLQRGGLLPASGTADSPPERGKE